MSGRFIFLKKKNKVYKNLLQYIYIYVYKQYLPVLDLTMLVTSLT